MKRRHLSGAALLLGAALFGYASTAAKAQDNAKPVFEAGTTMEMIQKRGKLVLGTKYDSPGYSLLNPATQQVEGFDIEIARIIAKALGLEPDAIEFKEAVSKNREPFVINGIVDIVIAAMAITDARRQIIGQAGPYYVAGTQLIVRIPDKDKFTNTESLKDRKICATTGGTPIASAKKFGADAIAFDTYDECVQQLLFGAVDGVLVGGGVAYGYAAKNPDKLTVTLEPFDPQRLSVALKKDDAPFCQFLQDTLKKSFENGSWQKAFEATLGEIGAPVTPPPALDERC